MQLGNITFDCDKPEVVGQFWSKVLGIEIDEGANEYFVSLGRTSSAITPNWFFLKVPEGKTVKNRLHLDLSTTDEEVDTTRLIDLGATKIESKNEWGISWTIFNDPEGNEFCMAAGEHD